MDDGGSRHDEDEAMDRQDRKAAIAAYKERKVEAGVFAVRCTATGEAWVGTAADVSTIRNRLWFALGHGSHPVRSLQDAWNAHGADAFSFEVLDRVDPDAPPHVRDDELRQAAELWRAELGAEGL
jgi:hypothetical protein